MKKQQRLISGDLQSYEFAGDRKLLEKDRFLFVYRFDSPSRGLREISWDAVEFDGEAVLFLSTPGAVHTIKSEVQAEAGERGRYLFNIFRFRENAIHGFASRCVELMECGLPWFDKTARPEESEISAPRHQRVPNQNSLSVGSQPHS